MNNKIKVLNNLASTIIILSLLSSIAGHVLIWYGYIELSDYALNIGCIALLLSILTMVIKSWIQTSEIQKNINFVVNAKNIMRDEYLKKVKESRENIKQEYKKLKNNK